MTHRAGFPVERLAANCDDSRAMAADLTDGEAIALRRERLGWNQTKLAKRVGVSLSTIVRVEDGGSTPSTRLAVVSVLEKEERRRGGGPTLSTPSGTTDPSQERVADVDAKLRKAVHRLEGLEIFATQTLDAIRKAKADLLEDVAEVRRKQG